LLTRVQESLWPTQKLDGIRQQIKEQEEKQLELRSVRADLAKLQAASNEVEENVQVIIRSNKTQR